MLLEILFVLASAILTTPLDEGTLAGGAYLNEIPDHIYTVCSDEGHTVEVLTRRNKVLGVSSFSPNSGCDPETEPTSSRVAMV